MILPSKELLREVLNADINSLSIIDESNIKVQGVEWWEECNINIYELAHICKEWAISKGFITHSIRNLKEYVVCLSGEFRVPSDVVRCKAEPEAIFKACEWVLAKMEDKDDNAK